MKIRYLALVGLLTIGTLGQPNAVAAEQAEPYPLEYWALRAVIDQAGVSPDGKHLALLKIPNKDGNPVLEVYKTGNLDAEPFRLNADPMEITQFFWVSDRHIAFLARQQVRDKIEGFNQGVYETRVAVLDIVDQEVDQIREPNPGFEGFLVDKPGKVIISFNEGGADGPGSKLSEAFRPRAYWEYDVERGTKKLLIRGKLSLGNITFNGIGQPWVARGFDLPNNELVWYWRRPGTSVWEEMHRLDIDKFETFQVLELDDTKQDHVLVLAENGDDKVGLWSFDAANGEFSELVYRRSDVDVTGIRRSSNTWTKPDQPVGVMYFKDKYHVEYFDEVEEGMYKQLEQIIPHSYYVQVISRSRDGGTMTVRNTGPRDPGTYYLLHDGQFKVVGSRQPLLESERLADLKYVTYPSRDGKEIPGFLTVPNSEPPYPLIVLPHGGPFVQEIKIYDEWAQMLANNGYLVLQPQYRGSRGYGTDFYTSAFRDGGEGGYAMQDDKDDGALWLVEQGLADPERMAMFGWSYGGYAALVAASRTPQIYQCVIAGAAVSDPLMQVNYYRWQLRGAPGLEQINMWDDSISPIKEAAKVNVRMLVIHGDVDQRVPPEHAYKYIELLEEHNKNFKYVELEDADHFSNTLFFNHQLELYTSMMDFLKNDCGPGGIQARND